MLYMKPKTNRGFVAVLLALAVGILLFMTYAPAPDNGGQDTNDVSQAIWTFPDDPDIEMVTTYTIEENKQTWEITFPTVANYSDTEKPILIGSLIGYIPDTTTTQAHTLEIWQEGEETSTPGQAWLSFDSETDGYVVKIYGSTFGMVPMPELVKIVWTMTANPIEEPEE